MVAFVVSLCVIQSTLGRKHACYVYGIVCAGHYLAITGLHTFDVSHPWWLHQFTAAVAPVLVVFLLQNLPEYTKFHERLQWLAAVSILANGAGWLFQLLELNPALYSMLAYTLYGALVILLLMDGRNARVCRNTGWFNIFRWGVS